MSGQVSRCPFSQFQSTRAIAYSALVKISVQFLARDSMLSRAKNCTEILTNMVNLFSFKLQSKEAVFDHGPRQAPQICGQGTTMTTSTGNAIIAVWALILSFHDSRLSVRFHSQYSLVDIFIKLAIVGFIVGISTPGRYGL